jgi:hypothetical protein
MIGYDILGLANPHIKLKQIVLSVPRGSAIGCFDDEETFGVATSKLKKLLSTGHYPACRIHAHWSSAHKIVPRDKLIHNLKRYQMLAVQFPAIKIYVSHSCEYVENDSDVILDRVTLIKHLAPNCIPVNAPMRGPTPGGAVVEHHGSETHAKIGEIVSFDGADCADSDVVSWHENNSKAAIRFLWSHRFNLRQNGAFIPPKKRTAAPDLAYYKDITAMASLPPPCPEKQFPGQAITLKKPNLWKVMAEDKVGNHDPRANRPLLIVNHKCAYFELLNYRGAVVAKVGYYGNYGNGLWRYYSGQLGSGHSASEIANRCGSYPYIWFRASDKEKLYGPVCAYLRTPYFHD